MPRCTCWASVLPRARSSPASWPIACISLLRTEASVATFSRCVARYLRSGLVQPKSRPECHPRGVAVVSKPGPADALALGRERFLACQRIDMSQVADELGVNRVTLYRWFGSRDRFLVEVVWSLTREALDAIDASVGEQGAARVVGVSMQLLKTAIGSPALRRWLAEEGEHA